MKKDMNLLSNFFSEGEDIIGVLYYSPLIIRIIADYAKESGIVSEHSSDEDAIKAFTLNSIVFFFNVMAYEDSGYKTLLLSPEQEVFEWSAKSFVDNDCVLKQKVN